MQVIRRCALAVAVIAALALPAMAAAASPDTSAQLSSPCSSRAAATALIAGRQPAANCSQPRQRATQKAGAHRSRAALAIQY